MVANPNGLTAIVHGRSNARVPNSLDYIKELLDEAYVEKFGCEPEGEDAQSLHNIAMQLVANGVVLTRDKIELHRGSEDLGFRHIDG